MGRLKRFKMKILNLYAGIGGNRKLWGDEHEVTAIENVPKIAKIYQDFFPNDKVIVCDAHQYLLEHYKEFDFIWSSPPCPTHSKMSVFFSKSEKKWNKNRKPKYPDMNLYQEIIFLKTYFNGEWIVENVIGYYEPLIKPFIIDRHYFWSNSILTDKKFKGVKNFIKSHSQNEYGFDLRKYKTKHRKDVMIHNLVKPELGLHIFNMAFKEQQQTI